MESKYIILFTIAFILFFTGLGTALLSLMHTWFKCKYTDIVIWIDNKDKIL